MPLTAFVGALVALLPPALLRPKADKPTLDSEIERLTRDNRQLARSHARLVDHIERLEREVLLEQHLGSHWKAEAMRLASTQREAREAAEKAREAFNADVYAQYALPQNGRNALARAQALGAQNEWQSLGQVAQQAQQNYQQAQAQIQQLQARGQALQQGQQYAQNASGVPAFYGEGFCNCVPSRAQVWSAEQRDFPGQRIALNRP